MIRTSAPPASSPAPGDDHDDWENAADSASIAARSSNAPGSISIAARPQSSGDLDGATRAMQGLRILQPPAATDDGGNYPQQQQFNGSAPLALQRPAPMVRWTPVLVAGLENARERMTLPARGSDRALPQEPARAAPQLPPLSSYPPADHYIAWLSAADSSTRRQDYNPYENNSARVVTLFKTPQSAVPQCC
ncbi:mRNA-binding protein Encore [Phytophthora cinnamomi]|uniref:mRNA-binding protein Encore n=1 Tax=Phytophthora cinnamomi TaxID=4785 RepID=UPI00355A4BF7|nr:mRNA-binding protein Encore [Phytophthora cinnamomi]